MAELRHRAGLSQRDVCQRLAVAGFSMTVSHLSRLENGQRPVTVEKWLALALALHTDPILLLLPDERTSRAVSLASSYTASATAAWEWLRGESPLGVTSDGETSEAMLTRLLA